MYFYYTFLKIIFEKKYFSTAKFNIYQISIFFYTVYYNAVMSKIHLWH